MKSAPQNNTRITLNSHSIKTAYYTKSFVLQQGGEVRTSPGAYTSM
ncbi:hypothetical protein [Morganella morganii]